MKDAMVNIGPVSVPGVPVTEFSKIPGSKEAWDGIWRIVGPSAQRNLARNPLWVVIAAAYYEGLQHGASLAFDMAKPAEPEESETITLNGQTYRKVAA
ncbi:hypothetical protein PQQ75_25110 [Paraburkholderia aspalathi]|uniref:hypothetical protein n=1 Tax=Paraburkholderia aspalathi TaxID=1324617 RepID=UPI0038B77602